MEPLKPISGATNVHGIRNTLTESGREDQMTSARSRRKHRAVPVLLSSDENSDIQTSPAPVKSRRRLKRRENSHTAISPTAGNVSVNTVIPTKPSQPVTIFSDSEKTLSDDEVITPARRRQSRPQPLSINLAEERSSSEDEIITPTRRRRGNMSFSEAATPSRSPRKYEARDLEDDLADLSDNGMLFLKYLFKENTEPQFTWTLMEAKTLLLYRTPRKSHERTSCHR